MADLTVEEVYEGVREALGDSTMPGGSVHTNQRLEPFFKQAYEKLFERMRRAGVAKVRKTVYYNLPAYTSILSPAQLEVYDFGGPDLLAERGGLRSVQVTGVAAGAPAIVTAPGHGFSAGQEVIHTLCGSGADGRWFVTPIDQNTYSLRGSSLVLALNPVAGMASVSGEIFLPMDGKVAFTRSEPSQRLWEYKWEDDILHFVGSTEERQLRVTYFASGVPPTSGAVGIDGSRNFLINYTAGLASPSKGQHTRSNELMSLAMVELETFAHVKIKDLQRNIYQPPPYQRRKRY